MRQGDTREIRFVLCLHCGLAYANPQLDAEEITRLYTESYRETGVDDNHLAYKERQSRERISWLQANYRAENARVLEIGCSEGVLIRQMRDELNWNVTGIEPFAPYARYGREKWNLEIHEGFFPLANQMPPFDLVTFIHVIEHIPDPRKFFADVGRSLRREGYAFFETPNLWSPKIGRISANLFASPHLAILSPESIRLILEQCGFEIVKLEAKLNLRVLAQWRGADRADYHVAAPSRDLRHAMRVASSFRWAWIKENGVLSWRHFRSKLSTTLRQGFVKENYARFKRLLHRH